MQAWRVHKFGSPDSMALGEVARPEPGEGEIMVKVAAAGVGPWDAWIRSGHSALPQPLPLTLGSDLAGTVAAIGDGVTAFEVGEAVYGVTNARFIGGCSATAVQPCRSTAQPFSHGHAGDELGRSAGIPLERQRAFGVIQRRDFREEPIMDREHIKGAADKVKGAVKDTAGKVTGDEKMQAEGKMDKAKGAAHNAVGDAKDTARDATR
jgi:uncharacterized protein YjbJ (UPF0337 family)